MKKEIKQIFDKIDLWNFIGIIGIILILGWALLKAFGIIHSPVWVEMIPYFGVGITLASFIYKFGRLMQIIDGMKKDIETTKKDIVCLVSNEKRIDRLEHEHMLAMTGKLRLYNH